MNPLNLQAIDRKKEAEGGCGVIGMASAKQIAGRHLLSALHQMRNRGNGKGGGIAAAGLNGANFNVASEILENKTLLAIAYLDEKVKVTIEKQFITPLL